MKKFLVRRRSWRHSLAGCSRRNRPRPSTTSRGDRRGRRRGQAGTTTSGTTTSGVVGHGDGHRRESAQGSEQHPVQAQHLLRVRQLRRRGQVQADDRGARQVSAANRSAKVTLQGHTDERGSREYNIALGQKRADAVKRMMTLMGVQDVVIETVSFGKEKPKREGHDEAAWAENRRVDIVYSGE